MAFALTRQARERARRRRWAARLAALVAVAIVFSAGQVAVRKAERQAGLDERQAAELSVVAYPYANRSLTVSAGDTYGILMERAGVGGTEANAVFAAARDSYDLSTVRAGREILLSFDRASGRLARLSYHIDSEEMLEVVRNEGTDGPAFLAERRAIPYEVRIRTAEGEIESSLYASALAQGLDERAVIALADVFQWTVDFVMDVRRGDSYRFVYEERYLNGRYAMPGRIMAAKYVNAGRPHYAFRFETADGRSGHYDEDGGSLRRLFLKAPVEFRYISSGFTTGLRYISAFDAYTGHRAIDYAAPAGTPVRSVGEGTVTFAGWAGSYGYKVSVRHNSAYSTNYCHLSKMSVRVGAKVGQGQTIGLVGSTGYSTGPHLHYEMVKNGTKINPLAEDFPGVDPVPAGEMEAFRAVAERYRPQLD